MDPGFLFEDYKSAVFKKDIEAFASLFDEDVRVFDMWEKWACNGLPAWRKIAEHWFMSLGKNRDVVTFNDIQIQVKGELATASAFVRFTNISEQGEELRYLENRLTWVAQKKEGTWKIIHQHTSSPIDFETMKVILQQ